jgi:type 1 glutamine amidotransferase
VVGVALLIFSKTADYRHDNIPAATAALARVARELGHPADVTEDAQRFSAKSLQAFSAVIWLNTSGDVLEAAQRDAFAEFVRAGGGYVGVHSASASEPSWPFYAQLVGARFTGHPTLQGARLLVEDRQHPATRHLEREWLRRDEWYEFDRNPRQHVRVLVSVDEASYQGGQMGDHPLVWCHEVGAGRVFYTALGHSAEDYSDPDFVQHLRGGIEWATQPRVALGQA